MRLFASLAVLIYGFAPVNAFAQETPWVAADYVQVRLLSGVTAAGGAEMIPAGFEIRLAEGWHAYWRMPGDAGLPPRFDWSRSENVREVEILWPVPQRIEMAGLYSFGYHDDVILPLRVYPLDPARPVTLATEAAIMVCRDICVPQDVSLTLEIPHDGEAGPSASGPVIERAVKSVPAQGDLPALKIESAVVGPSAVVVNAFSQQGFEHADVFVEAGDLYVTAPPETTISDSDGRTAMIRVPAPEGVDNLINHISGQAVTLTLVNGRYAVEKTIDLK